MHQLHLFRTVLKHADLIADSPKKAFYRLKLIESMGSYWIEKESGAGGRVLDYKVWPHPDYESAEKHFRRIIRKKTDKKRKKRIYKVQK